MVESHSLTGLEPTGPDFCHSAGARMSLKPAGKCPSLSLSLGPSLPCPALPCLLAPWGLGAECHSGVWAAALQIWSHQGGSWTGRVSARQRELHLHPPVPADVEELWIGLNDLKLQMNFEWSDGTPVRFTYWHPFEPNNFRDSLEDCVTIWGPVRARGRGHLHPAPPQRALHHPCARANDTSGCISGWV